MPTPRAVMWWVGGGTVVAMLVIWVCPLAPLGGPTPRQRAEREPLERDDGKAGISFIFPGAKKRVMGLLSNTLDENKSCNMADGGSDFTPPATSKLKKTEGKTMDWSNCRLDLLGTQFTQTFLNEDSVSLFTELNQETNLSPEDDIEKAISLLPPHMKSTLLDCLSKQHFPSLVSGEEESPRNWYTEHLEFLLCWFGSFRRQLAVKTFHASTPAFALAPAPVPPLAFVPAPSPMVDPPAFVPAPSPMVDPPAYSPALSLISAPVNSPSSSGPSPVDSPGEIYPTPHHGGGPRSPPKSALVLAPNNDTSSNRSMIVAVVLTATGSMLFTSLLLYCYARFFGNSGYGQRDGRPLLTLSAGSSQKSLDLKNSISMDNIVTQSSKGEQSHDGHHNKQVSAFDTNSVDAPSSVVTSISDFSAEPPSSSVIPIVPPAPRPPPPHLMPPKKKSVLPPTPPLPPPTKPNLRPPPPPKGSLGLRPPLANSSSRRLLSPFGPSHTGSTHSGQDVDNEPKTKLKPFFWDKVLASPDQSMVWHQISSGSFQFNEEMIETLFGYSADKQQNADKWKSRANDHPSQYIQILDPKKSQNLAILLRALNVTTEELQDALMEGNELPSELLQTLIKMAPTADEELRLRLYAGETSHLGPAERFLKSMVDIPFAFKRLDALLFMRSLAEDISGIKKDLATIEEACKELKGSRLFKKLLEAVVKIGNRMNVGTYRGGAQAFKLDTLLKLADVKGTDGKTTLLHFVVQEIIRSEGMRAEREAKESGSISSLITIPSLNSDDGFGGSPRESGDHYRRLGLQVVSGLPNELGHVKNAALLDADAITIVAEHLSEELLKTKEFLNKELRNVEEDSGFHQSVKTFVESAELDVTLLLEEERRVRLLVKSTTDFFHGNAVKDEGLRLFVIVRDFLGMLDKACKEVRQGPRGVPKTPVNRESLDPSLLAPRQLLFPSSREQQLDSSSSDDGSP